MHHEQALVWTQQSAWQELKQLFSNETNTPWQLMMEHSEPNWGNRALKNIEIYLQAVRSSLRRQFFFFFSLDKSVDNNNMTGILNVTSCKLLVNIYLANNALKMPWVFYFGSPLKLMKHSGLIKEKKKEKNGQRIKIIPLSSLSHWTVYVLSALSYTVCVCVNSGD